MWGKGTLSLSGVVPLSQEEMHQLHADREVNQGRDALMDYSDDGGGFFGDVL